TTLASTLSLHDALPIFGDVGALPGGVGGAPRGPEGAVGGGRSVDGPQEVQALDDGPGTEVEVVLDELGELVRVDDGGAERVDVHGERLGRPDGVGELELAAAGQPWGDAVLGGPGGAGGGGGGPL